MNKIAIAKEVISKVSYTTIASISADAEPWNTPVLFATDEQYNFFWTSAVETQHSENIRQNPKVFLVVYDTSVPEGFSHGVYIQANAVELGDSDEIQHAAELVYARKNKTPRTADEFLEDAPRRMYKAVPERVWINMPVEPQTNPLGSREEITLV